MNEPNMTNEIQCVIFDCDGVLIDSEIISARLLIDELAQIGVTIDVAYVQQKYLGRSWSAIVDDMRLAHSIFLDEAFEANYRTRLLKAFDRELVKTDGVQKVLQQLNVPICVATSSSPSRVARSLELVGLTSFFGKNVFTSSEVKRGKPAPDLFLHAASQMEIPIENCLVIEDSLAGLKAAQAAGSLKLRYTGGSHLQNMTLLDADEFADITAISHWDEFFGIYCALKAPDF